MSACYVYIIHHATELDADGNPLPKYVGKGGGKRDKYWSNWRNPQITALIRAKQTRRAVRIATGLTEPEAYALESSEIKRIGRADKGEGPLLNRTDGGAGLPGHIPSSQTRAKLSAALKGRTLSAEHRAALSAANNGDNHRLGWKHSDETRAKIAAANTGKKHTAETRDKMSAANTGKKHTAETRDKMSAAQKSRPRKPHSAETRARMSAAAKARCERKRLAKLTPS
jgi:hypothetical protein